MRKRVVLAVSALAVSIAAVTVSLGPLNVASAAVGDFNFNQPQVVATGLQIPWGLTFLPDGSALISERATAQIKQLRPGQAPVTVATVPGVVPDGEGGLLGIAVSPTFASDQFIYAYFTAASDNRIVRFRLNAPQTQQVILSGLAKASIHDGGRIAFGPDGMLYAGVGDASNTANAQDMNSRNGKILRMTPTGGVPAGNPFANSLVYSLGHRNVQGLAWDAQGRLWATEFGQNTFDEINLIVAGGNYGWPIVEGIGTDARFRNPLVQWTTAEASPSGAAIVGNHLFAAALRGTRLWQVTLNGQGGVSGTAPLLQGQFGRLRAAVLGPDGWLWITTSNRDGRGTPVAADDRVVRFPPSDANPTTPAATTPAATTPAATTPAATTPAVTTPPPSGACSVRWNVQSQWSNGFVTDITVTNSGTPINGWALTWTFPGNQQITNFWNSVITSSGANITARNASWNPTIATNGTVNFGFQASFSGTNARPTTIRLNNAVCSIT